MISTRPNSLIYFISREYYGGYTSLECESYCSSINSNQHTWSYLLKYQNSKRLPYLILKKSFLGDDFTRHLFRTTKLSTSDCIVSSTYERNQAKLEF